jgi:hypothetical protein
MALFGMMGVFAEFERSIGGVQPSARHLDLDRPECARQRPPPAPVAMARHGSSAFIGGLLASLITRAWQHIVRRESALR